MAAPDNIIVLRTYPTQIEAHLARMRLLEAGIPCFLSNETLASLNLLYSPVAGVRLHVYARDTATAAELLYEPPPMFAERGGKLPTADPREPATVVCPRCGSQEVSSDAAAPASWWASMRGWLHRQLGTPQVRHCFSCGLDF